MHNDLKPLIYPPTGTPISPGWAMPTPEALNRTPGSMDRTGVEGAR